MRLIATSVRALAILIALGCVGAAASLLPRLNGGSAPRSRSPELPYVPGDAMRSLSGVDLSSVSRTWLIFLTTNCQYCIDSVPLYRGIEDAARQHRNEIQVVMVGLEPVEVVRAFARNHRVQPDRIVAASPHDLGIRTTPTLMVVDNKSIVQRVWVGQQSGARALSILTFLHGTLPAKSESGRMSSKQP